jgi:hypothetical protein
MSMVMEPIPPAVTRSAHRWRRTNRRADRQTRTRKGQDIPVEEQDIDDHLDRKAIEVARGAIEMRCHHLPDRLVA